jgi:hypothetical protein
VRVATAFTFRLLTRARARVATRLALRFLASARARAVTMAGAEVGLVEGRGFVLSWVGPWISLPNSGERLERVLVGMLWWHRGLWWMNMARHWNPSINIW